LSCFFVLLFFSLLFSLLCVCVCLGPDEPSFIVY
jgi:hypothetical protein